MAITARLWVAMDSTVAVLSWVTFVPAIAVRSWLGSEIRTRATWTAVP